VRAKSQAMAAALALLLAGAACAKSPAAGPQTLRLGYFANLTHAPAILGVEQGIFAAALGPNVKLETSIFNAGPAAVEAIFANSIDAAFVGPNPAINAFTKSGGAAIRIVAGSTSGGAALVVKPSIASAAQLKGKTLATPQLGNTQDVALRSWLKTQGLSTDTQGGGDVFIKPQENSQTLDTFKSGAIDGAWVPEPWASRLRIEGGGSILVDEASLWPSGQYATTVLVVRAEYLKAHRDVVKRLVLGDVRAIDKLNTDTAASEAAVGAALKALTGKSLKPDVLAAAWKRLTFTGDPLVATLARSARNALDLGLLKNATLTGIADLSLLNDALRAEGKPEVVAS
jgi:NitT/TauT family transport system substrate-binding protein